MDQLRVRRVFCRVVERGSFSAVARELGVSQSAISRQVAELEAQLGLTLLSRSTRTVTPTEVGRSYYHRLSRALNDLADAEQELCEGRAHMAGLVRIAAPGAFGRRFLVPVVARLLQQHPTLRAELLLSDKSIDLVGEGVDFAVRVGRTGPGSFARRRVGELRYAFVCTPDHVQQRGVPQSLPDLAPYDWVTETQTKVLIQKGSRELGVDLRDMVVRYESDDIESVLSATLMGLGVALLPRWMVDTPIAEGRLRHLLPDMELPTTPVCVLFSGDRRLPRRALAVCDALEAELGSQAATPPDASPSPGPQTSAPPEADS